MSTTLPFPYTQRFLEPADATSVVALQDIIVNSFTFAQRYDISLKSQEDFAERMTTRGHMSGIFVKETGQLIAYATLALCNDSWPVADMALPTVMAPCKPESLAILQNIVVHPWHRGHGLQLHLVNALLPLCPQQHRQHVMAQVLSHNPASLANMFKCGFYVRSAVITPLRKCKGLNMHFDFTAPSVAHDPATSVYVDPCTDFFLAMALFDFGGKGVAAHKTKLSTQSHEGYLLQIDLPTLSLALSHEPALALTPSHKLYLDADNPLLGEIDDSAMMLGPIVPKSWSPYDNECLRQVHFHKKTAGGNASGGCWVKSP